MEVLKKCLECGVEATCERELELFEKDKRRTYGRTNKCNVCSNKRKDLWKQDNAEKSRYYIEQWRVRKEYGISLELYRERMATSDVCERCGKDYNLVYDHCHDTMEFRGVLCRGCNAGLGLLGDNLDGIMKTAEYLSKVR